VNGRGRATARPDPKKKSVFERNSKQGPRLQRSHLAWEERLEIIEVIEATSEVNRTASCRENGKEFAFEYIG
jgi:hypothetical protein